jgi:hypothetical protein
MGYSKQRLYIHLGAFFIGVFSFSWMLLGLCLIAHYFISPAVAYQITKTDPDEIFNSKDTETAWRINNTVRILTIQSSVFSTIIYFIGLGISFLF